MPITAPAPGTAAQTHQLGCSHLFFLFLQRKGILEMTLEMTLEMALEMTGVQRTLLRSFRSPSASPWKFQPMKRLRISSGPLT